MARPRVACPVCRRSVVRRKDGTPAGHYPPATAAAAYGQLWCRDTGQTPTESARPPLPTPAP